MKDDVEAFIEIVMAEVLEDGWRAFVGNVEVHNLNALFVFSTCLHRLRRFNSLPAFYVGLGWLDRGDGLLDRVGLSGDGSGSGDGRGLTSAMGLWVGELSNFLIDKSL